MKLSEIKEGQEAVITGVKGEGAFRKRLLEMGIITGETIKAVKKSPLKDPVEYRILDYDVSLRNSEADLIEVTTSKKNGLNKTNYNPNSIRSHISNLKNSRISPDEYIKDNHSLYRERMIGEIYKLYEEKLKKSNSLDFDDLLIKALELIEDHEDVADYYKNKFEQILVDEYQDTNRDQYLLV